MLSYELVRTVMRDDRFTMPKGVFLAAQGITSGELWDISLKGLLSLDGAAHHRQRRLVSKAFTPRAAERLRTTCTEVITELLDNCAGEGRCDVVADIALKYPIPIICAMLGTPSGDWHLFSDWADDVLQNLRVERRERRGRHPARMECTDGLSRRYGTRTGVMRLAMTCCPI